jgi:hypothetical protein
VGLSDDQKAMLRLLAQREEGYEDMAALMGISVEEARARVKEALAEVEEEPATPAAAPPTPPPAPEPTPVAQPPAEPTPTPAPPAEAAAAATSPTSKPRKRAPMPSLKLPKDRGALIGLGAGALVVVVLVIVLIVGGSGGGGGGGGGQSEASGSEVSGSGTETGLTAAEEKNLTQAVLSPTNGGDASGRAIFGRFKKKVLLQVIAEGLEPSPKGQMYTVWLFRSPKVALQIGASPVGASGKLAAQFEIPVQLLAYVANGAFNQVDVASTPTAAYKAAFARAKRENRVPPYVGESVLRGTITSPAIKGK